MSENVAVIIVAIIGALPPTVAALVLLRKTSRNTKIIKEIHELTNSNLAAVKKKLAQVERQNRKLETLLTRHLTKKKK